MKVEKAPPRLYIFDMDGTLRWTIIPGQPCPNRSGEWRLMPKVKEKLRAITWGPPGPRLAVATNQNGVALGYLTKDTARRLVEDALMEAIGFIPQGTVIELCTCAPRSDCACRKPKPGMLLRILHTLGVAPEEAVFIGDMAIDQQAAAAAGVPFVWAHDFFGWADQP